MTLYARGLSPTTISLSLSADDMILYIENHKDTTRKLLELITEYSKVTGLDAMIFVFWMLSFKPTFSLSTFTFTI